MLGAPSREAGWGSEHASGDRNLTPDVALHQERADLTAVSRLLVTLDGDRPRPMAVPMSMSVPTPRGERDAVGTTRW